MSETTPAAAGAQEIAFSKRALKPLGEVPGLRCGALSPLVRIAPPDAPSDRAGLVAALTALTGQWTWAAPALLDPRLTVAMMFGDGDTSAVGQYLWPDADALGPGFRASVTSETVRLAGPISGEEVLLSCLDLAALDGVAEAEPLRMSFSLEQFWATLALLDAYRILLLRRRLSRQGGYPAGVSAAGLAESWKAGVAVLDPGWSVSLFALLRPDLVPPGFEARVAGVIDAMDGAGLLTRIAGERGDPLGDVYILGEGLDRLCKAVLAGIVHVGLTVERLRAEDEIELTTIGGWRTAGGFWLADLSAIPRGGSGEVVVSLLGPSYFAGLIEGALRGATRATAASPTPAAPFEMATPYTRDNLVRALTVSAAPTAPAAMSPAATSPAAASPAASTAAPTQTPAPAPTPTPTPAAEPVTAQPAATAAPVPTPAAPATPATPATPAAPAPKWAATHVVPAGGLTAWARPDPKSESVGLAAGLALAVVERLGDWAHVTASNGWSGWVDGRRLG